MPADISLGDNYSIDEDSNGNLVIIDDTTGDTVFQHTPGGNLEAVAPIDVNDILDATSNNTVYDTSTEQLGDGNQDASLGDITLADIVDAGSGNTVYDSSTETLGDGTQDGDFGSVSIDSQHNDSIVWVAPGDDLQSRFDAVPPGGIVAFEVGDHNISTMGTATVEKGVNVYMPGGINGGYNRSGAVLVNTGADTVDSPVITFTSSNVGSFTDRPRGYNHVINAEHEGDSPAIVYNEYEGVRTRPTILLNNSGNTGLRLKNGSFLTHIVHPYILEFTDYGIEIDDTGGAHQITGGTLGGGTTGSVGLRAHNETISIGTQFGGADVDVGAELIGSSCLMIGSYVEGPSIGFKVGESGELSGYSRIVYPKFKFATDTAVKFVNSFISGVERPRTNNDTYEFAANSDRDYLLANSSALETGTVTIDSNAEETSVMFENKVTTDFRRSKLNVEVEGMVIYNKNDKNLNIYDGSDWILPDGTVA